MKKLYPLRPRASFISVTAAFMIIGLMITFSTHAQEAFDGVVRIKVTDALASRLSQADLATNARGEIVTGVESLDQLNRQFRVRRLTRVFPPAGKHEAKHKKYGLHLWYEVQTDKSVPVPAIIQSYQAQTEIVKAEPVYKKALIGAGAPGFGPLIVSPAGQTAILPAAPDDPMLGNQWHYNNTGQSGGVAGADISLLDAWKIETGQPHVVVAVNDGGIQTNHPDLAANMWVNAGEVPGNNIDDDNNGYIDDVNGYSFVQRTGKISAYDHGTHVAGTIAAVTNNGRGVAGIAGGSGKGDGVRLMSCAVFATDSLADGFADAYVYSADNGAVISQNSWGYMFPEVYEQVVLDAIDYFIAEAGKDENGNPAGPMSGGLVIFSAGNENNEARYFPAAYEPVMAVASTTHRDTRAGYSNYGSWVDISAPGGETYQSRSQGVLSTLPGNQYGYFMGTSMACPHVTGVAALVISRFEKNRLTPEAVRRRLIHSVDPIDALNPQYKGKLGSGRINAALALTEHDPVAPNAISDLAVDSKDIGQITLRWTSPSDDDGVVVSYDLRYATSPITEDNFYSATRAENVPPPGPQGSTEKFTITGLPGGVTYYFAIRSRDFEGNVSAMSNVVREVSALAPQISVSPAALTLKLETAQKATRNITIANKGRGLLKFQLTSETGNKDSATFLPSEGSIAPGGSMQIAVTFNAAGLLAGTWTQKIIVTHNDPAQPPLTIPLTLQVENNGAPIASLTPSVLDFKSVQVGATAWRAVSITNSGSEPLVISKISSTSAAFSADVSGSVSIARFTTEQIRILYSPTVTGQSSATITFHTNDPDRQTMKVSARGEGLQAPPVVASPSAFSETLEQGATVTRTMTLTNNGSQDRTFSVRVENPRVSGDVSDPANESAARAGSAVDTTQSTARARLQEKQAKLASKNPEAIRAIGQEWNRKKSAERSSRTLQTPTATKAIYDTDFENFTTGPLDDQNGWYGTDGWSVSETNPDTGKRHLRGESVVSGTGEKFALSPYIVESDEFYPRYTSAAVRINADEARGTAWQIVPQDPWSYIATRIQFNADGSIQALVIDENYEFHWKKVADTTPSGYFDVAIEYNNWGSDTSGFPTYYLFINNQHVFSGTGLASGIGQVALVSTMDKSGPVLDADGFRLFGGEMIPSFISPRPADGTIPAGGSVSVDLDFDASIIKYGTYTSDVVVDLDGPDSLLLPAVMTVTGEAGLVSDTHFIDLEMNKGESAHALVTLTNTGGRPVHYELTLETEIPGLLIKPTSGTIAVREEAVIRVEYNGEPGIHETRLLVTTDIKDHPVDPITVDIVQYDEGAAFFAPDIATFNIVAGEISTRSIRLRNDGENSVSFLADVTALPSWISADVEKGTIHGRPLDINFTLDARQLTAGTLQREIRFNTNDINGRVHETLLKINILPDTIRGGKITWEQWTNVPGNDVASIPLDRVPDSTALITMFETDVNAGDNYGDRIRGYIQAPATGNYIFWISSNDRSELWLSTDRKAENRKKIAFVSGYTRPGEWNKYASQKSAAIRLIAGRKYYIEALHKEGVGSDHIAVGWQLPDGTLERPVTGTRLFPYTAEQNGSHPVISIVSPRDGEIFSAPATIELRAQASDSDGHVVKVEFFNAGEKVGTDIRAPFVLSLSGLDAGEYIFTAKATDESGAITTANRKITVVPGQSCAEAGLIVREQWNNVPGTLISSIPVNSSPSLTQTLTRFESPSNIGDNYGTRIRGYLCVPVTGEYTFWISSNDKSELWLSRDSSPRNKTKIASVSGYTDPRQWDKYPSQQSPSLYLEAGQKYYIEALQKEGVGTDHLAVGWRLPGGTDERPIPGVRLLPFNVPGNAAPVVMITSPADSSTLFSPAQITIAAEASDADGSISKVEFFNGSRKLGQDIAAPWTYNWKNVGDGIYNITVVATDDEGAITASTPLRVSVETMCTASGSITREVWNNISGNLVSAVPTNRTADNVEALYLFEGPANVGSNYGARISGYLCPPQTGDYYFWIASNDHSELWLSTDADPRDKQLIAHVNGATSPRDWDHLSTQKSAPVHLIKGKRYYIEALHKQGVGTDHISVGWQLPDGTLERPIGGDRLAPSTTAPPAVAEASETLTAVDAEGVIGIQLYPNPLEGETLHVVVDNLPQTGAMHREISILQVTGLPLYTRTDQCQGACDAEIKLERELPPGVYIVQVKIEERTFVRKLVVP